MQYTVPHYYHKFHCTADQCEDTCCAGWQIMIDKRSLKKYRKVKGPFGNRLMNSIDWKEGAFLQYDGRCAFLDENNLCDICSELGPDMFCKTCKNYPRHIEEFPNVREISLSLSCMEAGKLILGGTSPVQFVTKETQKEEKEEEQFEYFLYDKLLTVRESAIRILQNRKEKMGLRIAMALGLAHDAECKIRKGNLFGVDDVCMRYEKEGASQRFLKQLKECQDEQFERFQAMQELWAIFGELEILRTQWPTYIKDLEHVLYHSEQEYRRMRAEFQENVLCKHPYSEQLMIYFVFTYFCGGVYDGRAYSKMLMAVVSTLLIEELALAVFWKNEKKFTFMDMVEVAHHYSREVEHSDENLETLERIVAEKDYLWYNKLLCSEL